MMSPPPIGTPDTSGLAGTSLTRRRFIGQAGLAVGTLSCVDLLGLPGIAHASGRPEPAREGLFTDGVAAGEPSPHGINLWTRLDHPGGDRLVGLEVARDPDFAKVVFSDRVQARASRGGSVKVRLDDRRALDPGEQYFYRFETGEESSPVGAFRTLRPVDSRAPVRIAFFSCQAYEAGYYGAHSAIAEEDVDLVVCLGDYIYERAFGFRGPDGREDTQGPNGDGDVQTLAEYRGKYRLYRSDPNLRRMHATHAFAATWDDHEVSDDYTGDAHPDDRPLRVPFAERRRNGYRAFFESLPIMRDPHDRYRIYRGFRLGRTVDLTMIDTRQYSDPPPCTRTVIPCGGYDDPRRHLGDDQKRWLLARLRRSQADWKIVANPAPMMAIESAPGVPVDPRNWDGYRAERRELLEQVRRDGVENLAFVTGAIHTFLAAEVGPDGRGGSPVATEFVPGSITTTGLPESLSFATGGAVPPDVARAVTEQIRVTNPHIKYDDQRAHGYGVLEARRDELRVTFKAVDRFDPRARKSTVLAEFRVPAGAPRIDVV